MMMSMATVAVAWGDQPTTHLSVIGEGYSHSQVNTPIYRVNSVTSRGDTQYAAYYDPDGYVTLAKRRLGSDKWTVRRTDHRGEVADGHNMISIGIDGDGFLHVAFNHHNTPLKYARSVAPGSLELGELQPMTGVEEDKLTYPEFYTLSDGDMIFAYRSGMSGNGNMVMNRYDHKRRRWKRVHANLIDGEGERNAYWQMWLDDNDVIHVSWVWRETGDVASNHDLCYARSADGGKTWTRSDNSVYALPITAANAEYACRIPQNSELINQTSMTADGDSHPYIATHWAEEGDVSPQYRIVWHDGTRWHVEKVYDRTTPYSLSQPGLPYFFMARPKVVAHGNRIGLIFRDSARGDVVSYAYADLGGDGEWQIVDLTDFPVYSWEPSFDTELWRSKKMLDIFVQTTNEPSGKRRASTPVYILETGF